MMVQTSVVFDGSRIRLKANATFIKDLLDDVRPKSQVNDTGSRDPACHEHSGTTNLPVQHCGRALNGFLQFLTASVGVCGILHLDSSFSTHEFRETVPVKAESSG